VKYIGIKEKSKPYEKKNAVYVLIVNPSNEIAAINIKEFGFLLPCGQKPNDNVFNEISLEIGHELHEIKLHEKFGAYYSIKLNNEMIYSDVKIDLYIARIYEEGNDETIDGHEIVWKKPEVLYEKMALDFQRHILEDIIKQGIV